MSKYWSRTIQEITPYVPGEQPQAARLVKLNTNENPYPPAPDVLAAMRNAVSEELRLYPDPECARLKKAAADYYRLPESSIFVGNGSDEILAFCFKAFFNPGDCVVFPDITYSFYEVYAALFQVSFKLIPLTEQFDVPVQRFMEEKSDGVILANPNAPTGKLISLEDIGRIAAGNQDKVVIIDEAYIDFGGQSAVGMIGEFPNLLIIHTFSKSRSLAGLRVGLALGHPDLIEGLNRVKNSFNSYTMDRIALAGAEQSFKSPEAFTANLDKIIATRETTCRRLGELGFEIVDSKANFIFISHPGTKAVHIFEELRKRNIIVRHFRKPRIDNHLRVTIGTNEEMDLLYEALKEIIEAQHRRGTC